jgi:DNA polymerase-3 subunit alpha
MDIFDELRGSAEEDNLNFTHLHVHTTYSFLDGFNDPKRVAKRAKELGMKAIAITDHNHVGGVIDFQQACIKEGIKPILGCEMYWTWDTNILSKSKEERDEWAIARAKASGFDIDSAIHKIEHPISEKTGKPLKPKKISKSDLNTLIEPYEYDSKQYHIILLAINQTGWRNLVKLQSEAAEKCTFNGRYCCDDEMLAKYSEGLIMSTACIGNCIPTLINQGFYQEAEEQIDKWHAIFGDRFYIEIQPLNIQEQRMANFIMLQHAANKGIKTIATTDAHYTLKEDHDDHDTLLCIGIGKTKSDPNRLHYSNDFWIKSYDEMIETFSTQADSMTEMFEELFDADSYMETVRVSLENTNKIADMVEDIKLGSDVNLFPRIEIPFGMTPEGYLTMTCFQNLYKYKNTHPEIDIKLYERRLNEELKVINTKGFAPYILVVKDYIKWANEHGCPTGPGRGSGAGSLVLFVLGITKIIDPIKYNLLFFRFLTIDRTAPPDIDTDFEYYNRDRVIAYLQEKYGYECVAHIGSYSELGVKSGLKDVGRVLEIDYGAINDLTAKVDTWLDKPDLSFSDLDKLKDSDREPERHAWEEFNNYELQYPELFRLARRFEGVTRNYGVHASGVLITPDAINSLFPTRVKDGVTITLYTGVQLEELKAIKFDLLGLKTLSVIKETLNAIDESLTMDDLYNMVDINDAEMFSMIQQKQTDGLFQIESDLFKGMVESIVPNTMNDIIVITSLGRPGPLSAGMDKSYAERKHGRQEAVEPLPGTWEVVKDTYGTICYQEQIMLISKIVAKFNDNQSDTYLRKAFAKKKKDKMLMCRQWFIYGKINEKAPEGYDADNKNQPAYDPNGKCGPAIPGGIANGYTEQQLVAFWTNIEGFADYLFNKSHAACYSYITILTAWLKKYHTAEFIAALMSVQGDAKKLDNYSKVARTLDITVKAPDINRSDRDFTAIENDVLFGLGSVSGVGAASVPDIINNRPYNSLEEVFEKIPKKSINKRVAIALAKAGAFDQFDDNRYRVINTIYDLRKDDDERYDENAYDEGACIELEKDVLGTPVTFIPFWDNVMAGEDITVTLKIEKVQEKMDKKGNMMGFLTGSYDGCSIRCVIFARQYTANVGKLDKNHNEYVTLKGKKDDKGALVVSKVMDNPMPMKKKPSCIAEPELDDRLEGVI